MKTIFLNGTIKDIQYFLAEDDEFGIQELDGILVVDRIAYPGDSIKYSLDTALVDMYDLFRDMLFEDIDQYYKEVSSLPIWVQAAGQNSDMPISADTFTHYINKSNIPNLFRHLYLVDCQFLIGTVQNLLYAMETSFISFYQLIASISFSRDYSDFTDENGTLYVLGPQSTQVSNTIETYFTKTYSILDLMCKICYEIQNLQTEFNEYQKTRSSKVLWGSKNKLQINGAKGTIFENCDMISSIVAIRNEIVHNGTWELNPKVFIRFENGEEAERYMLFPDMEQGHLATVKSRKHFFSSNIKINALLPTIHLEFKRRLLATLETIRCVYVR